LIFMILMFIGSSPGSIGGGVKTTTFALFVATVATIAHERDEVEIFGRTIPQDQVFRAISIIALSTGWICLTTFILLIFEQGFSFIQVFFEVVSALSLCGLPTHVTASFSIFGKLMIMFTMLLGRMGTLTLVFALWAKKKKQLFNYPEEQIIVG
jgi:trk system potassium uptake protein